MRSGMAEVNISKLQKIAIQLTLKRPQGELKVLKYQQGIC